MYQRGQEKDHGRLITVDYSAGERSPGGLPARSELGGSEIGVAQGDQVLEGAVGAGLAEVAVGAQGADGVSEGYLCGGFAGVGLVELLGLGDEVSELSQELGCAGDCGVDQSLELLQAVRLPSSAEPSRRLVRNTTVFVYPVKPLTHQSFE